MPAIEIQGLSKRFGDLAAVDDLTFRAREGAVTGFLGPNGAGKSTRRCGCFSASCGRRRASATIGGKRYVELGEPIRRVGAVLEADAFHPGRARTGSPPCARRRGGTARSPASRRCSARVDLADDGDRRVEGLLARHAPAARSGRARCSASRDVLILDEPANGLDPEGISWLRQFLRDFADGGGTVLVSSHVLAEVAQTVDDVVIIAHGRLVAESSLAELVNRSRSGVRVRTPQAEALRAALAAQGVSAQLVGPDAITALETTPETVVSRLQAQEQSSTRSTPERFNLEEMFLELTTRPKGESDEEPHSRRAAQAPDDRGCSGSTSRSRSRSCPSPSRSASPPRRTVRRSEPRGRAEVHVRRIGRRPARLLLVGISMVAGEFRHNTATGTFLISPDRRRAMAAKLIAARSSASASLPLPRCSPSPSPCRGSPRRTSRSASSAPTWACPFSAPSWARLSPPWSGSAWAR